MQLQLLFPFFLGKSLKSIGCLAAPQGHNAEVAEETSGLDLSLVCDFLKIIELKQILSFTYSAFLDKN